MPRPLVIGNGTLLVALDRDLCIRDLTFPRVGLLNHLSGNRVRIGLWMAGKFAWLADPAWQKRLAYEPDTLVTRAECRHEGLGVSLVVSDCVLHRMNILLRRFDLTNLHEEAREARLFLSSDYHIAETDIGDTAFYDPFRDAVIHYKRDTYLLMGGEAGGGGLFQYTTGVKGFQGAEGTWRDAEDGWLGMNPVEQGSVDSTLSLRVTLPGRSTEMLRAWVCVGRTLEQVAELQETLKTEGFEALRHNTAHYWKAWSYHPAREPKLGALPAPVATLFRRSILVIRTQIDSGGAILAANDSDIMETARAHYAYMWPRDGALVTAVLDELGYEDLPRRFFLFCRDLLPKERPVLLHKYSSDGSWGATWHPWQVDGKAEIPFQQDSTALVLWALWRHYLKHNDIGFVDGLYRDLVVPAADFMLAYRDPATGLPLPSYDLWEERRGIHAYTCGTVYAALTAAAHLAQVFDDPRASAYEQAAAQMKAGVEAQFWDEGVGRYVRRITPQSDGSFQKDFTIDAAVFGLWAFGMFGPRDPHIADTQQRTHARLAVQTRLGGQARYEADYYFRRSDDFAQVPGNPWIICTCWAAQYDLACATSRADLAGALQRLEWVATRAGESGILPEQVHPFTGEHLAVAPLTWSHAEFLATTLRYLELYSSLPD